MLSGKLVVRRADPELAQAHEGESMGTGVYMKPRSIIKGSLSSDDIKDVPSVASILLFPNSVNNNSKSLSCSSKIQRLQRLLQYDYSFDVNEETHVDALSFCVGASHPMLKGGTIVTTVLESIYAFGSVRARENSILDPSRKLRKRDVLLHLPTVDFTAGIKNVFIPHNSNSYSDDGLTICFPRMQGGRMTIRILGGFDSVTDDGMFTHHADGDDTTIASPVAATIDNFPAIAEGIKVIGDFGISSFSLVNETNVKEFPELDIFEHNKFASRLPIRDISLIVEVGEGGEEEREDFGDDNNDDDAGTTGIGFDSSNCAV